MNRKLIAVVLGALVAPLCFAAGASTTPSALPKFIITISGPLKGVNPETTVRYGVSVKNTGTKKVAMIRIGLADQRIIASTSVPYRTVMGKLYAGDPTAMWTVKNFKPGARYKLALGFNFPVTPGASWAQFTVAVFVGYQPIANTHKEVTVTYKPSG